MAWTCVSLSEVCEIVSGSTPKTGVAKYWDGDIPWATPKDLSSLDGAYIETTPRRISREGLKSCAATLLPAGSVLFSSRAPIGHVAINTVPMATNQGFKSLVPQLDRLEAKYLFHWLHANRSYLESLGNGATFKEVSKAVVARVQIPLPPIEEQRRIADILDRADALRDKRREALAHLDDLNQSFFLDMFGDPRWNPCSWPTVQLADLIAPDDRINYGVVQPGDESPGGIGLVRAGDIVGGRVLHASLKRIDPSIERAYKRSRIRGNEVLVTCVGSIGAIAVARGSEVGLNVARAVARVPIESPTFREYVAAHLRTDSVQRYWINELRTVAQPTLNIKQLAETRIMRPPSSMVEKFASTVDRFDVGVANQLADQIHLDKLFAALQQRAFSGRL